MPKIYPLHHSDEELKAKAAELSAQISAHNHSSDNFENLIRDSVLFNVTYIELQSREAKKVTRLMTTLTWVSAIVAVASLLVAWLSYSATSSGDKWQQRELELLKLIAENTAPTPVATSQIAVPTKPKKGFK